MNTDAKKMIILLTLFLIISVILISGCVGTNNSSNSATSKYIAIDEVKQEDANVIEGQLYNFTAPIMFMNDATLEPVYPDQPGKYGVTANRSLSALYFNYYSLYGPYRNVTFVRGIYGFPYRLESGVIILGIDQNSTVRMRYNNESINLTMGDMWKSPIVSSRIENRTGYNGSLVKIEYDTYWWIYSEPGSYSK